MLMSDEFIFLWLKPVIVTMWPADQQCEYHLRVLEIQILGLHLTPTKSEIQVELMFEYFRLRHLILW